MEKLTVLDISRINGINIHTQKMGLGNIIQDLIIENESMRAELKLTNTISKQKNDK